jgi:hypothetical protein
VDAFIRKYANVVIGRLSGFDRLVLRGTMRAISYAKGLFGFMCGNGILLKEFGRFAEIASECLKEASVAAAQRLGRPVLYLESHNQRKDQLAREIAERDGIKDGLICVLTAVEPCRSFDIFKNRETKRLELVARRRKCLFHYHYLLHPRFGFMHVRLQSWLPYDVQIWINGREWLSRQLDSKSIGYCRRSNTFAWIEDVARAQRLASAHLRIRWPQHLNALLDDVRPALRDIFNGSPPDYYWSVHQSEWATDIMFRDPESLAAIYPRLVRHGITQFGSTDVMRFLGRRLTSSGTIPATFKGEVVTDLRERPEGLRIKHAIDWNSIKLYDKEGSVLRVETTINRPQDFKVFRPAEGAEDGPHSWRPMRQGVADLHRRAKVSQASNDRYLTALAAIDTRLALGTLTRPLALPVTVDTRRYRALNPSAPDDLALFAAVNRGEFAVGGFRNADLRNLLYATPAEPDDKAEHRRRSARVTRLIRLLRAHGLVAKVQKTHRYNLTIDGRRKIAAILAARDTAVDELVRNAA